MQYLPEFDSVDTGGKSPGMDEKSVAAGPWRWVGLHRAMLFFAACFVALTAVALVVVENPLLAVAGALGLSAAGTVFAATFLGNCKISDVIRGNRHGLTPREYVVAFDLMSALMDSMPANFLVKDRNHRYILVNKTMGEWFGWDPADVIGKTFEEISWGRDYSSENAQIREHDEYVLTTGKTAERYFEVQRADGKWIKILSKRFPIRAANGDIVGVAVTNMDVTDLEETRQEYEDIRRERDRQASIFRNFFEAFPFPAGMKSVDGRFMTVNSQLLKWNTFPTQDIIGKRLDEIVGPELAKESLALDRKVLETRQPASFERVTKYYDGTERILQILRFPLINQDGEMLGLGLFNIDVTDQRAAERMLKEANEALESTVNERTAELQMANSDLKQALEELKATTDLLIESDRMASLGAMVAGMAHEINTPIGVGVTAASLVRDKVDVLMKEVGAGTLTRDGMASAMDVIDEASDVMLRNMARADALIRSLKQVAVDQTNLDTRDVDLEKYIQEVELSVAPVLKKSGITVELDCQPGLVVNLQPGPLAQVMTNLLMNIVHHAYPEGQGGRVRIATVLTDAGVEVRVHDFGVGMDAETVGQIFVPFFTTRRNKGGTGLGLSIVYNVARSVLGGEITCLSEKGKGSVFTLTLPKSSLVSSDS